MEKKRNQVVKRNYVINLLINCGEATSTDTVHQVFFSSATLLCYHVHHLQDCTALTPMGPLWGVVLWFS